MEFPLLLFSRPGTANSTPGHGGPSKIVRPSSTRQGQRLMPYFRNLQNYFNESRGILQSSTTGIEPEQVLVFETIGNIKDFANAVKKIDGFTWMGEIETEEITPDEDFYKESNHEASLGGRLYFVMSNQRALEEMLSLWKRYAEDSDMVFQRGLTKFRDVFLNLKKIRRWSLEDRIEESGVIEFWKEQLTHFPDGKIKFEVELWYKKTIAKQIATEEIVKNLIMELGGEVRTRYVNDEIAYHALLGELPAKSVQELINDQNVSLFKCDNVMFIRPQGQFAVDKVLLNDDEVDVSFEDKVYPNISSPIVAVLDGYPLENHELISDRIIVDDPDEWEQDYPVIDRQHGTAMASMIIHGDLDGSGQPLNRPIYIRPILKPNPTDFTSPREECIPDDRLMLDLIHIAVKRIKEGEAGQTAEAPDVKIINLSFGDASRPFLGAMSPLARLIDWLSNKYKILFIISAGNHSVTINTQMSSSDLRKLNKEDLEDFVVKEIFQDARNRKILSPAESINCITVGAQHYDWSNPSYYGYLIDVYSKALPSPISAFGSGYRKSIKPDMLFPGGRVLFDERYTNSKVDLHLSQGTKAPGNCVAAPSKEPGNTKNKQYTSGTSNSTALVSRVASEYHDYILDIFNEQIPDLLPDHYMVPLIKAMLIHGCYWGEMKNWISDIILDESNSAIIRKLISRWIGYGVPDTEKVLSCNNQRATLMGFGELNDREAHVYELPLPPSLSAKTEWRKLTVTLAWISPISPTTQLYRNAQLWFDFGDGAPSRTIKEKLRASSSNSDINTTKRGTVQHEVYEGEGAIAITDGDKLVIKVNCRKDASKIDSDIAYGLMVSLEVKETLDIEIYNEIKTRIKQTVEVNQRI
ncbi:MAG: S8 family peptidase [Candidatus Neomarinimicrobiota bacterium]